ncbi:MAG: MBL fold metallo-hydrolase [Anaerolineae bacterium]|jgi:hydroxyacylglutathione hydrolase
MDRIRAISLPMPFMLGTVSCYLVATGTGFVFIDTGASNQRRELERELSSAGCLPGNLHLIVLTHGDFDHTGNAAYLRNRFGAKIAMHRDDAGMAQHGDMFLNRSSGNAILRSLAPILFRFSKSNRFEPDLYTGDGDNLSEHSLDAQIVAIPGHSRGSIGILTSAGDLFCGDLLENTKKPALNSLMDDAAACQTSIEKLEGLEIATVYPGHGEPFPMERFTSSRQ